MLIRYRNFAACLVMCIPMLNTIAAPPLPDRIPVTDPKALLAIAIDSLDGRAYGMLTGDVAGAITRHFSATSPLFIDVTTLARYAQEGCRRFNVRFWQEGVRIGATALPAKQTIDIGLNYCRHGMPPAHLRLEGRP